jgi:hypothetical protein
MTRIAFLLLAHQDPDSVIAQAECLTSSGDMVVIHFDRRAALRDYRAIRAALKDNPGVAFPQRRGSCGWGDWSLVAACLEMLRCGLESFPSATHFHLISGDCMPIKSAEYVRAHLDRADCDLIETVDFFEGGWIKTGLREERLIYRHWVNERRHPRLFYGNLALQQRLGLTRRLPEGLQIMIGSQWWCLRRKTVAALLELIARPPDLSRFFRRSWIPDETFFQSLVAHLVPRAERRSRSPTFLMFTDYGMPVTFYNDHHDLLLRQDFLFARKISREAQDLRRRLGDLWLAKGRDCPISNEGPKLFTFLTGQGRIGQRFAPPAWDGGNPAGEARRVRLILAKKWHQAKDLTRLIRDRSDIPVLDYVFDEIEAGLPDLGGIQTSLDKRRRHCPALIDLLFEEYGSDQLVLCLDPSAVALIRDLIAAGTELHILLMEDDFESCELQGHMRRVGLIDDGTPLAERAGLEPVLRREWRGEIEAIAALDLENVQRLAPVMDEARRARAIAAFLGLSDDLALRLAHDWLQA